MKKKLLMLLNLVLFLPFAINAYEVKTEWHNSIGGNNFEIASDAHYLKDGSIITIGTFFSDDIEDLENKGGTDIFVSKYDKDGNNIWKTRWGGNGTENITGTFMTKSEELIVYGNYNSTDIQEFENNGSTNIFILKYDKDGKIIFEKNIAGDDNEVLRFLSVTDDGYIIAGQFAGTNFQGLKSNGSSNYFIIKYDKDWNIIWKTSWGGNGNDLISCVNITEKNEIIITGIVSSTNIDGMTIKGEKDGIILKFNKNGELLWEKSWGGNSRENFHNILILEDESIIVSAESSSSDIEGLEYKNESHRSVIIKYDKDGNMLWQKSWGGANQDVLNPLCVEKDGFVLYGYFSSTDIENLENKGDFDGVLVKFDFDGNVIWQKPWGGNLNDLSVEAFFNERKELIVNANFTSNDINGITNKGSTDILILKYNQDGKLLFQYHLGGNSGDAVKKVIMNDLNEMFVLWQSQSTDIDKIENKGLTDVLISKYSIKYDIEIMETLNGNFTINQQGKYGIITPTPNEGYEVDQIVVKDTDGNEIEVTKQEDGTYSFPLYDDVSVEVIYKEKIENPKTGIMDFITIIFVGLFISLSGFYIVKRYNERLEF